MNLLTGWGMAASFRRLTDEKRFHDPDG